MDFQTFQNIVEIIARVLFGLICIGFVLGACLHKKHKVFKDIFEGILFILMMHGLVLMLEFAVFGN